MGLGSWLRGDGWNGGRYDEDDESYDDGTDDGPDGGSDEVGCPSFDCGCKPCALLARLCVHEAGHIVVYLAFQVPFDHAYVSVDRAGSQADGRVVDGEYHHIEGDELINHMVITMAGAAAEQLVYGGVAMADGDDESIDAYIEGDKPYDTITDLNLDEVEAEAADIIDEWGDHLDLVARELFEHGQLTYADVLELTGVSA